nr:DAK2 domain-containing protein [Cellulosimicrobium arenosum]
MRRATDALGTVRHEIDRINVFPVSDADTGTNMYLTLVDALEAIEGPGAEDPVGSEGPAGADRAEGAGAADEVPPGLGVVLARAARGALVGARGNSGVILSEYLRGLAVALAQASDADGAALARALAEASRSARRAVARPVPGTVLTAADAVATAAAGIVLGADRLRERSPGAPAPVVPVGPVVVAARRAARAAAERSPDELDVLARSQVLDAGAVGLVVLLGALDEVVHGGSGDAVSEVRAMISGMDVVTARPAGPAAGARALPGSHDDPGAGEFEVMFVLDPARVRPTGPVRVPAVDALRAALDTLGESVVVVGGGAVRGPGPGAVATGGVWQAHVHTDDPLAAVAAGRRAARALAGDPGAMRHVRVRHLAVPTAAGPGDGAGSTGLVAVTGAPGLVADLARAGAVVLVCSPEVPLGIGALRRAVVDTGSSSVVVLPGRPVEESTVVALDESARSHGVGRVEVLATPTDVHVVLALAAGHLLDPGATLAARVSAMRDAVAHGRVVELDLRAGQDQRPDVAGLVRDLVGAGGMLTVVPDDGAAPDLVASFASVAGDVGAECVVLPSGRDGTRALVGAEGPV